jgi:cobyrinic acid a,c-diamide synthase
LSAGESAQRFCQGKLRVAIKPSPANGPLHANILTATHCGDDVQQKYAFLVAGTQSGCGKTTIAMGLMAACRHRGLRVQPFKVGPDFIDPGFHTRITGRTSRNLDGWMLSRSYNEGVFQRLLATTDVCVVEGVMGLYDGYDGRSEDGSSAQMAKWLGLPVILVVDARSMARSAAALILGFRCFDPGVALAGVIFNRIGSAGHLEYLRQAMAASLPDIPVLGGIPRQEEIRIPERHLGLVMADELNIDAEWQEHLLQMAARHLNMDLILDRARRLDREGPGTRESSGSDRIAAPRVPVAVARDAAFCFYYEDNLELLHSAGADLTFFSPLAGETFPESSAGLYLGGGYPELHAAELSSRSVFLAGIRRAAERGMPIYAECGGLMALSRFIETAAGEKHSMAGILPFGTRMLERRKALGYTEVMLRRPCLLGDSGVRLRGHEFHYSEICNADETTDAGYAYQIQGRKENGVRLEGYQIGSVLASYIHLHLGSAPSAARDWVATCRRYQASR